MAISGTRVRRLARYISDYQLIRQYRLPTVCPTIIVGHFVVDVFVADWSASRRPPAQNRAASIPTRSHRQRNPSQGIATNDGARAVGADFRLLPPDRAGG